MSTELYDVGIIGAGVAGCLAALRISEKNPLIKTVVLELGRPFGKRRRFLEGALGCLPNSDGKLYTSDVEKVATIVDAKSTKAAHAWVMEKFGKVNSMKVLKDVFPTPTMQHRLKEANFNIHLNSYIQWRPEQVHQLSKIIADNMSRADNTHFVFDNEVHKIYKNKDVFVITSAEGEFRCKKLILCVGRSGWRWVTALYKDLGLTVSDDVAKFGIRAEMPAQHLKEFNNSHCTLIRKELEVGPFCYNGTVIPEDHADVVISSFRSNEDRWNSDNVSFSILSSSIFKNNGVAQSDRLSKLAFLLFNDRIGKEKIKMFMKDDSAISLLPEYQWLKKSITELNEFIPELINKGSLHAPAIITLPSKINLGNNLESEIDGMFIAGESSGIDGIMSAAIMGTICADNAIEGLNG